jgi:RNA polymerase sigma factor (sigma-70 family)
VAWRRVGSADEPEAYVRRVMINAHARKHRRKLKEFLAPKDGSGLAREVPDSGDPIARADDRGALITALAQLPPRQRQAVVLRYWEDLSESQAAEAMGCSVGAVKSNAAKGIAKLRVIPGLADTVTHGGRK